jgi:phenylpropionate dioxygenase-like ring-hydroxylating dioxygenase large terminal subunit
VGLHPDYWHPVALGESLKRGHVVAARFAGEPIALMRGASGKLYAFEDRCPHRQFPLHRGVVEGERLRCGYHGWLWNGDGACSEAPGARRVPPAHRLRRYPVREAFGLIFVFPGDPSLAERVPLPVVPGFDLPRGAIYSAREVGCHYTFMFENLMDMSHQFLHRRLMGGIEAEVRDLREGERHVEVEYHFRKARGGMRAGGRLVLGRSDVTEAKCLARVKIRVEYPYQTLEVFRPGRSEPTAVMWAANVPVDREQTRCFSVGFLTLRQTRFRGVFALMRPIIQRFVDAVFAEDRAAVELEQRAYDEQGGDWNREVSPVIFRLQDLMRRHGVPIETLAGGSAHAHNRFAR